MEIESLNDIENPNVFHLRFLYYLMMNFDFWKVKSSYQVAKHFGKGNEGNYNTAKKDLIRAGYISDRDGEIKLNPKKEQIKMFVDVAKKDSSISLKLRRYEKEYMKELNTKESQEFYKREYKRYKDFNK